MAVDSPGCTFVHEALPGRIVLGAGSRRCLADELDLLGAERILVVVASELADLTGQLTEALAFRRSAINGICNLGMHGD